LRIPKVIVPAIPQLMTPAINSELGRLVKMVNREELIAPAIKPAIVLPIKIRKASLMVKRRRCK
jgi:hypothetical protein